ncbi:MAG: hypothetical protein ACRENU_12300 [Gemmatimonadaceae bacterium]
MSDHDRPELRAFKELETLVRGLGEELAVFRRRAIAAESQLKDGGQASRGKAAAHGGRMADMEEENQLLKLRLERAEDRVRQMMERVRFLRQQLQSSPTGVGAGRS